MLQLLTWGEIGGWTSELSNWAEVATILTGVVVAGFGLRETLRRWAVPIFGRRFGTWPVKITVTKVELWRYDLSDPDRARNWILRMELRLTPRWGTYSERRHPALAGKFWADGLGPVRSITAEEAGRDLIDRAHLIQVDRRLVGQIVFDFGPDVLKPGTLYEFRIRGLAVFPPDEDRWVYTTLRATATDVSNPGLVPQLTTDESTADFSAGGG